MCSDHGDLSNTGSVVISGKSRVGWSARFVHGGEGSHPGLCHELWVRRLCDGGDAALDNALRGSGLALLRPVLAGLFE